MFKNFMGLLVAAVFLGGCASNSSKESDPNYDSAGKGKPVKVTQTSRGAQLTSDERLLFDTGKAEIKQDGMVYIDRVATILKTKTKANVAVEGHTDNVGGSVLNQQLSVRRANAVKDALVKQGVAATRIQAQGMGMTKPVADNNSPDGRQANRRTDIIVLGETVDAIGGASLSDQLNQGLERFLKGANEIMKNVFGG